MDLSFKVQEHLSEVNLEVYTQASKLINGSKFNEAETKLRALIDSFTEEKSVGRILGLLRLAKLNYERGEYLYSIQNAESVIKTLQPQKVEGEEANEHQINPDETYLLFKAKYFHAKCLHKIKDYTKAEELINEIIEKADLDTEAQPYHKFAVLASYLKARQMINCMEFRRAKEILEDQAKPYIKRLIKKFQPSEIDDPTIDLINNKYSFQWRKKYAMYLRKFACYDQALEQMKNILKDEIEFYKLETKAEGEEESKQTVQVVDLAQINDYSEQKYSWNAGQIPHIQIRTTYYQIAKIYAFTLNINKTIEIIDTVDSITNKVFGTFETLYSAKCKKLLAEGHLKGNTGRNSQVLNTSLKLAQECNELYVRILGDGANYLVAKSLLTIGEILLEQKKVEEGERSNLNAQIMIGEKFSDNHPCIIEFNSNLIESYSASSDPEVKKKSLLVSEKNLEIAKKYYGEESIYTVKHELSVASNKIGQVQIAEAQQNIANMRKIVQRYHDDNPRDLTNQYLFLGQVLVAITLMNTTSADSAERILSYVYSKQLEYLENQRDHPFLEQTVINLAIYYRSIQQYSPSLQFWEQLRKIQEKMYGDSNEVLVYTYKNIGICYLALGLPEKAEENYTKALTIMNVLGDQSRDNELLKEDREQLAAIYFNLYLSALSNEDKEKAIEYNQKALEYNKLVHGENSLEVSNNYFLYSQLLLKSGKADEAKDQMLQAIEIIESGNQYDKRFDELMLIKVRFYASLANLCYFKGDYIDAQKHLSTALAICNDESKFTYDTVQDFKKIQKELILISKRCEAKLKKVSSLDLYPKQLPSAQVEAESAAIGPMLGVFSSTSFAFFAISYFLLKNKQ